MFKSGGGVGIEKTHASSSFTVATAAATAAIVVSVTISAIVVSAMWQ